MAKVKQFTLIHYIMFEIQNIDGELVVDSRLIAQEFGILHNSLKDTINDNATDIEEDFGVIRRESKPSFTSNQNETVYFLTEDQATYIMTLSRNTPQVKKAKRNLVLAFTKAKKIIQDQQIDMKTVLGMLQGMQDKLTQQEQTMLQLTARTQRLDELEQQERSFGQAAQIHSGCAEVLVDQMENAIDDQQMTAIEFTRYAGIDSSYARKIARTASAFEKCGKGIERCPKQYGTNHLLLEMRYLKQAAKVVLKLN